MGVAARPAGLKGEAVTRDEISMARYATIVTPNATAAGVSCNCPRGVSSARESNPHSRRHPMQDPPLNFDLGDTIDSLRDAAVDFAAHEIAPRAAESDRDNLFPHAHCKKLGELEIGRAHV